MGQPVATLTLDELIPVLVQRSRHQISSRVYLANVHMLMEAEQNPRLQQALARADYLLPDGRPLCWWHRLVNRIPCPQIRGYDLVLAVLASAERHQLKVALYGGMSDTDLHKVCQNLLTLFPALPLVYAQVPPVAAEIVLPAADFQALHDSHADIILVGLGCPKQEIFIDQHCADLPALQLAVGAVFDFLSGRRKLPPRWASRLGLEWLFRWMQEPRRLAERYIRHNPKFLFRFLRAWFTGKYKQRA